MTRPGRIRLRSWLLTGLGGIVAVALVTALFSIADVSFDEVAMLVVRANPAAVAALIGATGVHILLAAEKWRLVEARLGEAPARAEAFAYSAMGTAAGQLLPTHVANALCRGLGNKYHRAGNGVRGALTSVWEQLFDLLVVVLLLPAAALALLVGEPSLMVSVGGGLLLAGAVALFPITKASVELLGRTAGRAGAAARSLASSGLIEHQLLLRLYFLSIARILVLWTMTALVGLAIDSSIPFIDYAVALPLVIFASVATMLPAGFGANEWSFAVTLAALGTPLAAATAWTAVNRILVAQASLLLGLVGLFVIALSNRAGAKPT